MSNFGQIIETYVMRGETWLTIWEFETARKFTIRNARKSGLEQGMLVAYERPGQSAEMLINSISEDDLPPDYLPVQDIKIFSGATSQLPPFLRG